MAVAEKTTPRSKAQIHRDAIAGLVERRDTLTKLIADAPAMLAELRDNEIRSAPTGGRAGARGSKVFEHQRKLTESTKELANIEGELASRQRLLMEEEQVEQEKLRKSLLRDAQDFAEREGVLLDACGEKARGFFLAYAEYISVVEAKANHLAGFTISDADTAAELRQAFQPVLRPLPADAAALFDVIAEIATSAEHQQAGQPVSTIGASNPDPHLNPDSFRETLEARANDILIGNYPRPDLLKAPAVVRANHRVEGLAEHVPDLTGLDIRPSDVISGPRFGKDGRGRPPAIGTQFAGVRADSMWPMPGEAA